MGLGYTMTKREEARDTPNCEKGKINRDCRQIRIITREKDKRRKIQLKTPRPIDGLNQPTLKAK